ncbi:MAG: GNAT family N-acetyltransferase [Candidatus Melainabacteria bacterium]|nr:GNAT family N-acetyltransferase [Candidatus Melainabacteria bacterium]
MRKSKLGLIAGGPPCTAYRIDPPKGLTVRDGQLDDLTGIIRIVNSKNNRLSFGWVQKVVLADAVKHQREEGEKSQHRLRVVTDSTGRIVAFLRAYHRNDGTTTLHEIGVAEDMQSRGIGTYLIMELIHASQKRGMLKIGLKTPVGMRSNNYYPSFGFKQVGTFNGRKRVLNCYELEL